MRWDGKVKDLMDNSMRLLKGLVKLLLIFVILFITYFLLGESVDYEFIPTISQITWKWIFYLFGGIEAVKLLINCRFISALFVFILVEGVHSGETGLFGVVFMIPGIIGFIKFLSFVMKAFVDVFQGDKGVRRYFRKKRELRKTRKRLQKRYAKAEEPLTEMASKPKAEDREVWTVRVNGEAYKVFGTPDEVESMAKTLSSN